MKTLKKIWGSIVRAWRFAVWVWKNRNILARECARRMGIMFAVYGLLIVGGLVGQTGTVIVNQVQAEAKIATSTPRSIPPILQKIAKCESKLGQYGKTGQVQINATLDIGKYQINIPANGALATKMGYDLSKPADNESFAIWLFENRGTDPWNSSKACWGK